MCVSILRPIRVVKKYLAARTSRSAPKLGTRAIVDSPYIDRRMAYNMSTCPQPRDQKGHIGHEHRPSPILSSPPHNKDNSWMPKS